MDKKTKKIISRFTFTAFLAAFLFLACTIVPSGRNKSGKIFKYSTELLKKKIIVYPEIFYPDDCTLMTVKYLSYLIKKGNRVLIIGTETGIQAMVAAQFEAKQIISTDIQSTALSNARENSKRLGFSDIIEFYLISLDSKNLAYGDALEGKLFDIILFVEICGRHIQSGLLPVDVGINTLRKKRIKTLLNIKNRMLKEFALGIKDHLIPGGIAIMEYDDSMEFLKKTTHETGITFDLLSETLDGCGTFIVQGY